MYEREKIVTDVLDVGDTVETKVLQGLVTDFFQNNYLSRQKPALLIIKQEVIINRYKNLSRVMSYTETPTLSFLAEL